ncbi:hypothetical protein [Marichromatium sp. AB32]|uniref:hypothetical protein n=1 Tax=Marichromatium sp. AB32 TaxID=2483363 RepID=UPI000F41B7A1|nr:hypothetical protein [Marichromatium sp. AB32]RNE94644.1 hypothetical protein EBL85_00425 [Marichromatium sp. AB32]
MTIDELRKLAPDVFGDKSEAEIVAALAEYRGVDPQLQAYELGLDIKDYAPRPSVGEIIAENWFLILLFAMLLTAWALRRQLAAWATELPPFNKSLIAGGGFFIFSSLFPPIKYAESTSYYSDKEEAFKLLWNLNRNEAIDWSILAIEWTVIVVATLVIAVSLPKKPN